MVPLPRNLMSRRSIDRRDLLAAHTLQRPVNDSDLLIVKACDPDCYLRSRWRNRSANVFGASPGFRPKSLSENDFAARALRSAALLASAAAATRAAPSASRLASASRCSGVRNFSGASGTGISFDSVVGLFPVT